MKPVISPEMNDHLCKMSEQPKHAHELTSLFSLDYIWEHSDRNWNWDWVALNCGMQKYIEKADIFLTRKPPVIYEIPHRLDLVTFEKYLPLLNLYKLYETPQIKQSIDGLSYGITTEVYYKYQDWLPTGWNAVRVAYEEWCLKDLDETTDLHETTDVDYETFSWSSIVSLKQALCHPWRKWDYATILDNEVEPVSFDLILENLDLILKNNGGDFSLVWSSMAGIEDALKHLEHLDFMRKNNGRHFMLVWSSVADIQNILKHPELNWRYEKVLYRKEFDFEKDFRRLPKEVQSEYLSILVKHFDESLPKKYLDDHVY